MTSPSVRSTSRSTPCVLGCCGPMLTSISSVRTSNSTIVWSSGSVLAVAMVLSTPDAVVFERKLVVLAERMADPVLGQQDAAQVGVAREPDAAEVVHLALVPVRGRPDAGD